MQRMYYFFPVKGNQGQLTTFSGSGEVSSIRVSGLQQ